MVNKSQKCPLCGYYNVYVGITTIECGYDLNCPNWTNRQEKIVKKLLEKYATAAKKLSNSCNFDLDWDTKEETTDPLFAKFGYNDDNDDYYD